MTSARTPTVATIQVGDAAIGPDVEPFVIAEVSGNHNGDLQRALAIVAAAPEAGAHAIKLQTYRPRAITIDADGPACQISGDHKLWAGRNLYQLYEQAHTPWEWHEPIFERIRDHAIPPSSSPPPPPA